MREIAEATILTTDEVLTEFLTFFAENTHWRNRAGQTVQALLDAPDVKIVPREPINLPGRPRALSH